MKVLICAYRDWAISSMNFLGDGMNLQDREFHFAKSKEEFDNLNKERFDLALFIGWSWKVAPAFLTLNPSFCFHPSPLPKYRGGSPIQNQIINGEVESAGTYFRMNEGIDAGPIVWQESFSLEGSLSEILVRLTALAQLGAKHILDRYPDLSYQDQDESKATYFPRRKAQMSEITIEELQSSSALVLHNKIRALQDPYPTAFIRTADGQRLKILGTQIS